MAFLGSDLRAVVWKKAVTCGPMCVEDLWGFGLGPSVSQAKGGSWLAEGSLLGVPESLRVRGGSSYSPQLGESWELFPGLQLTLRNDPI